jgi:2-keto-4-pentenoate hydratase/2-oxohepta-3-ene-1,7-dioic acid hydratase in catechol pathway
MTIFCVGRNYAAHAREMGASADPGEELVVFLKPEQARLDAPGEIRFPPGAGEVHHEAEIVVRVGPGPSVEAVALGLDLTDRTRQADAKKRGLPWATAKGFRTAACVGPFVPASAVGPVERLRFGLRVNGRARQRGDAALMLRAVPELLAAIDRWFGLRPGDLVFTGTPEGVAALAPGDVCELDLEGVPAASARFAVAPTGT